MTRKTPMNSVEDFVRELVRSTLWDVGYHERELREAKKVLKAVEEMLQRSDFDLEHLKEIETDEDELIEAGFEDIEHLAAALLANRSGLLKHHEDGVQNGCHHLGMVKTLLSRGGFDIDIAEIQKQVDADLHKP